jgi:hypoxanthine phosphoribosyltransferase
VSTLSVDEALQRTGGKPIRRIIYDEETIAARVRELGAEVSDYYRDGGELLVLGLLKGSFIFLGDLVRRIDRPLQVDFIVASSYGAEQRSSGAVRLLYDPETRLEGKHILLVEDIIDTGTTLRCLLDLLRARGPRSLSVCALLDKGLVADPPPEIRFVGFRAPKAFLVGYGLDYAEEYRHLPFIADMA